LLETFAQIRAQFPGIRLAQVGGLWTDEQRELIGRLGIGDAVEQMRGLSRSMLAAFYRRASAVLLTSQAEGFGLPLIEALACGAVVVASDLEVFREVGGEAPLYTNVGDVDAWTTTVADLLGGRIAPARREGRLEHASRYTWAAHARTVAESYLRLAH
jgi:glycosyltransferase involved in cell wall biosynthesis